MTGALALAAFGMLALGAAAMLLLFLRDRAGQPALRTYRQAHASGRVLLDRVEEDTTRWPT